MGIGWPQLLLIAIVILVLFGRGRISEMMGDFGKGISSFKKGMNEDIDEASEPKAQIEAPAADAKTADTSTAKTSDAAKS